MDRQGNNREPANRGRRLDWSRNGDRVLIGLYVACGLLFLADFFYEKHSHFFFEDWFGFFAWFSFICCVAQILAAKAMRKWLKRDEDYYD